MLKRLTLWSDEQLSEKRHELITEIARHARDLQKLKVQIMRQQTIGRLTTAQSELSEIEGEIAERQSRAENRETFFSNF